MSINLKVSIILAALFIVLLGLNAGVLFHAVLPSFNKLERQQAEQDMRRVVNALNSKIANLDTINHDQASCNKAYDFAVSRNPFYIKSSLIPETFYADHINLLFIYGNDGNIIWGRSYDLVAKAFISLGNLRKEGFAKRYSLIIGKTHDATITGMVETERGPMLISSRPIITSNGAGPIRGTMIMGRLLDGAVLASLSKRTHIKLDIRDLKKSGLSGALTKRNFTVIPTGEHSIDVFTTLDDLNGTPIALLHTRRPLSITEGGEKAIIYALVLMAISSVTVIIAVLFLLQGMILTPLSTMTIHVVRLGMKGLLAEQLPIDRRDEIGRIARAFNRMQKRISTLVHRDELTGLTNRSLFIDRSSQVLKLARREKFNVAFLFLDLDNFKNINDTFGHHIGDHLLKAVAARLRAELRECDTISRMGGDEFTIVAHGYSNRDEFTEIGRKIINLFKAPFDADGTMIDITTSVGISIFPDHGDDVKTLLRNADAALYRAKEKGRNNFHLFTPS